MAKGTWNRVVARALVLGVPCGVMCLEAPAALADLAADLNADQRFLIWKLTADKALAVANERRLAANEQHALNKQLDERDRVLRTAEARAFANAAALARVRKERDKIAKQRQALVAALAEQDRALAAEVRAFREVITGIATSRDPRKQKALQRFADGEQREAVDELCEIAAANRTARINAAYIAEAADLRPAAWLARQARDLGKMRLEEVVQLYERITRLDPGVPRDWIQLARLYDEQGRLAEARKAAQSAQANLSGIGGGRDRAAVLEQLGDIAAQAGNLQDAKARFEEGLRIRSKLAMDNPTSASAQRNLSVSLTNLGDVAAQAGDLKSARARFEHGLCVARKLAKANPTSSATQRVLSVSLNKLGDIAIQAGDLKEAEARFEEALRIRSRLVEASPVSAAAARDVSVSLNHLGAVAVQAGDLKGAKVRFEESLSIARKRARSNATSATAQRDLSVSLSNLGAVAAQTGDLKEAKAWFEEALDIDRKLAKVNPTSTAAQRDVSVSLNNLGDVAVQMGDVANARVRFEESVDIARRLVRDSPTSATAQRDLIISLVRLSDVTSNSNLLHEALEITRELERTGRLAPRDRHFLELIPKTIESMPARL